MNDDDRAWLRLAGFALAHASWSVEDGETLCTLAIVARAGNEERELVRFEAPSIPVSVEMAQAELASLRGDDRAVLVFDGHVTPEGGERTDGLMAQLLQPAPAIRGLAIQPYRAAKRRRFRFLGGATGFALVGEPYLVADFGDEGADAELLAGFREHPQGTRLLGG
jgi:hypothetical protein